MADQPDTLTVPLRTPVTLGTGPAALSFSELKLREPTAAELMQWDKLSGAEADIMAVSVVSGVPKAAVEMIGVRDLNQAAKFIAGFFA
jgi:hypothetical protein